MSRLDIVVYPRDLNGAEAAFNRLGWQTLERFGDGVEEYGIVFRIPADDVRLELVTHAESRALAHDRSAATPSPACASGSPTRMPPGAPPGLPGSGSTRRAAEGPADAAFGRLVRTFAPGGLRDRLRADAGAAARGRRSPPAE